MFEAYDTFRLAKQIPDERIPMGTIGVVLMVHLGKAPVYEVEFCDADGRSIGSKPTYTLTEDYLATDAKMQRRK